MASSRMNPLGFTALHLTAYLGLGEIMESFLGDMVEKPNLEPRDQHNDTTRPCSTRRVYGSRKIAARTQS
jgi:hypothetical protein